MLSRLPLHQAPRIQEVVDNEIIYLPIKSLKPHPKNREIYEPDLDFRRDPGFLEGIRKEGILDPLTVLTDRETVVGGTRRLQAALKLGIDVVPCYVRDFTNPIIALIELNPQRVNPDVERYHEAQVLRAEYEKEARGRQLAGKPLVKSDERMPEPLDVREVVAKQIGISPAKLTMLEQVMQKASPQDVRRLHEGLETVNSLHNTLFKPNVHTPRICLGQYYAGKFALSSDIIALMPAHKTYCEPFGGYASVLLNKPESEIEVYNDISLDLNNLMLSLREYTLELVALISQTPYSRWYFMQIVEELNAEPCKPIDVRRAAKFWACNQMVFNGLKRKPSEGDFRCDASSNRTFVRDLHGLLYAAARLRNVQIENRDAFRVIQHYDKPDTLFYIDPPYISTDQALGNDMSPERHKELAGILRGLQGRWILTYGDCEEARSLYENNHIKEVIMPQQAPVSDGSSKKDAWIQLIITNCELSSAKGNNSVPRLPPL